MDDSVVSRSQNDHQSLSYRSWEIPGPSPNMVDDNETTQTQRSREEPKIQPSRMRRREKKKIYKGNFPNMRDDQTIRPLRQANLSNQGRSRSARSAILKNLNVKIRAGNTGVRFATEELEQAEQEGEEVSYMVKP